LYLPCAPVSAAGGVQKIALCNHTGVWCADILDMNVGGAGAKFLAVVPSESVGEIDVDFDAVN
jgi:hypothetical protein